MCVGPKVSVAADSASVNSCSASFRAPLSGTNDAERIEKDGLKCFPIHFGCKDLPRLLISFGGLVVVLSETEAPTLIPQRGHRIPEGHRILADAILGGLHHLYVRV